MKFGDRVHDTVDNDFGTVVKCEDVHNVLVIFDYSEEWPLADRNYVDNNMMGGVGLYCLSIGCEDSCAERLELVGESPKETLWMIERWCEHNVHENKQQ